MQCALFTSGSDISMMSCGLFCVAFAAYSLWFWIGKPKTIATDRFLSEVSGPYLIYCLIVGLVKDPSQWWFCVSVVAAIAILLTYFIRLDRRRG
ncbi:MAG: hypothetical protein K2O33_06845 [Muribaculaceae bacterium]|nr:hypothetical protein [Muribaculaceae bacterium]